MTVWPVVTYYVPNADMDAGDIAVGQLWRHVVTQASNRVVVEITGVDRGTGLAFTSAADPHAIPVGDLLAYWECCRR